MSATMTTVHQWPAAWTTLRAGPELDLLVAEHMGATWQERERGRATFAMPGSAEILAGRDRDGRIAVYYGLRKCSRAIDQAMIYAEWLNTLALGYFSGGAEPWPRTAYLTLTRCTERTWAATFQLAGEDWESDGASHGVAHAATAPMAIVRAGLLCRRTVT